MAFDMQLLERIRSCLLNSNCPIAFKKNANNIFEIQGVGIRGTVYTNIIVCPISETLTEDKLNECKRKDIQAIIFTSDDKMYEISIPQNDISFEAFKRLIFAVPVYGCVSDKEYHAIYELFTCIASCGLRSETVYKIPGLTLDNRLFIFNGTQVAAEKSTSLTLQEKSDSLTAFNMLINCCKKEKSMLLTELFMISAVFEVIKQMSVTDMRNCMPTFVPYLYGESGVGKTTIIKTFFAEMDDCNRFVSLANATDSGILKRISSICSGMVIVDDVPHISANKCSRNSMKSLEAVIRTYGDIGAEKVTAVSKPIKVRAWAVITAEGLFLQVKSSIHRVLPIELEKGEVNFENIETLKLNKTGFNVFMLSFLKWFFQKAKFNDGKWQILNISDIYKKCRKEMYDKYNCMESRIYDAHCQIMMYFRFFSQFFLEIGVSPEEISSLELSLRELLFNIAKRQTLYCAENTLPYYIKVYLSELLESEKIGELNPNGTTGYSIFGDDEKFQAYRYDNYLFFTVKQKNSFFESIIKTASHLGRYTKKDVKNTLLKMGIVYVPQSREPTSE